MRFHAVKYINIGSCVITEKHIIRICMAVYSHLEALPTEVWPNSACRARASRSLSRYACSRSAADLGEATSACLEREVKMQTCQYMNKISNL